MITTVDHRHIMLLKVSPLRKFMSNCPTKHLRLGYRLAAEGATRHDFVPFASDNLHNVYACEGWLTRLGPNLATAPAAQLTQKSDEQWKTVTSWMPLDDAKLVLDPNGAWYDEAVEGEVMEGNAGPSAPKKQARSRVSVSDRVFLGTVFLFNHYILLEAS